MSDISRRIKKAEKKLEPEKGHWLRFPLPEGGFIEVPGCRSLIDVAALVGARRHKEKMDETERK